MPLKKTTFCILLSFCNILIFSLLQLNVFRIIPLFCFAHFYSVAYFLNFVANILILTSMKFFTPKSVVVATTLLMTVAANAQSTYITKASDKPFDFANAKDYVVLYAPEAAVEKMGNKIIGDNNLDPAMTRNQFYYWTTDWDATSLVLADVVEENGKNSLGGSDYINMTPLYDWGGGSFTSKTQAYDLSKVTDNMILHVGLRDFGSVAPKFKIAIGKMANISTNGFELETNLAVGASDGNYVGVGNMGHDAQWYNLEIPVKDLVDENGQFGFSYNFSTPFPLGESAVQLSFASPECSQATSIMEPGNTVKTYTITKLGSAMSVDGIWFYTLDTTGISSVGTNENYAPLAVYDMSGRKVESQTEGGIYIVKTANGVRKVIKR